MEKYGFIYIWHDRKRKMYYIGCHWGTENDGYICSSNRMRDAYRRRPQDFKRRIIQRGIERNSLLEEEHKWLSLISDEELGKKYYNMSKIHFRHWSENPQTRLTVGQKISKSPNRSKNIGLANKGKRRTPEEKQNLREKNLGKKLSEETKKKISAANTGKKRSESFRIKMSIIAKQRILKPVTEETKKKMSEAHKRRYEELRRKKSDD